MILENSIEEFIERFREYAAPGHLYPRLEGSPLLEFSAAGRVLYLLERTSPYAMRAGDTRVIVHPVLKDIWLEPQDSSDNPHLNMSPEEKALKEKLFVSGISGVHGVGQVLEMQKGFVIVRARIPLVLGVLDDVMPKFLVGEWVRFESESPLHGFVIT
jgi:hypothetical protein